MLFADTGAILASIVLAYGSTLRATRRRPRLVSTKITALLAIQLSDWPELSDWPDRARGER